MLLSKSHRPKACLHLPLCRAGPCSSEQCRSGLARSDPPPSLTSLAVSVFPSATNTCSKSSFQGDKGQVAVISQGPRGAVLILWEPASLFSSRHEEAPCRPFPETRLAALPLVCSQPLCFCPTSSPATLAIHGTEGAPRITSAPSGPPHWAESGVASGRSDSFTECSKGFHRKCIEHSGVPPACPWLSTRSCYTVDAQ